MSLSTHGVEKFKGWFHCLLSLLPLSLGGLLALQMLDLPYVESLSMEPKKTAKDFVKRMGLASCHHVNYLQDAAEACRAGGLTTKCVYHPNSTCNIFKADAEEEGGESKAQAPDLFIAGFPCAPFSAQRVGRFDKRTGSYA